VYIVSITNSRKKFRQYLKRVFLSCYCIVNYLFLITAKYWLKTVSLIVIQEPPIMSKYNDTILMHNMR